ncbi:hypothetical protein AH06_00385 [candidate division TM6 bacterium Zodletone_IIa]|jgi:L-asparagine transporter-like permease|nr:hypothetical protein AH06_00385 [candidate division TM6 bacterium Zodletone_IIa]MBA4197607.1 hypothetical protein [Chitinophaga sp.]
MFTKKTVKAFSIVAIILSSLGLLLSVVGTLIIPNNSTTFAFVLGIISWTILLWASVIGFKLCRSYNLYDDEYKKAGYRIYAIVLAFILFFFVGLIVGLGIAVILLSTLWGLKRNYDEWENNDPITYEVSSSEVTTNDTTLDNS